MNRPTTLGFLASALVMALPLVAGCGNDRAASAVSYTAADLATGSEVSVSSLRGTPVLLVSWATWCNECDEELSGLQDFAESNAADGITIVAVNIDASDVGDEINAKIDKHGLTTSLWRDKRNEFKRAFGALGVPTTVLLDANGAMVGLFAGAVDFHEQQVLDALEEVRGT
ncbi:MAG: TlpA disulfide reductase family protein [Ilumatobacteraceae bacterium]